MPAFPAATYLQTLKAHPRRYTPNRTCAVLTNHGAVDHASLRYQLCLQESRTHPCALLVGLSANMMRPRPQLSITLPRNFTFHYTDGQGPRTPEKDEQPEPSQPSPPRPYRVRTRRPATSLQRFKGYASSGALPGDIPIPSVEVPEPSSPTHNQTTASDVSAEPGLLAPRHPRLRFVTPPKTPLLMDSSFAENSLAARHGWSSQEEADSVESTSRPASACSIFSDSSISSSETSVSFPSTGESCTSPENDASDPFTLPISTANTKGKGRAAPDLQEIDGGALVKSSRQAKQAKWTDEMDLHLWTTYLLYLQDPTVTPFHTNPGKPPPLGVCHRVTREAKRTWRGSRSALRSVSDTGGISRDARGKQILRDVHDDANAVTTTSRTNPMFTGIAGNATGAGLQVVKSGSRWPRSDSATRRRLRELCRQKSSHSSRLQRVLQSRSPTPAAETGPHLASAFDNLADQASFSTRDMAVSLTTSTSKTMRPDGVLAMLSRGNGGTEQPRDDWFGQPIGQPQEEVVQVPQLGLGIVGVSRTVGSTRLGSPFVARRRPETIRASHLRPTASRHHFNTFTGVGPTRKTHARLTSATLPLPSALKRRAQHQLEDEFSPGGSEMPRNLLEELLGSPAIGGLHRRVRSRGFSLGDVSVADQLSSLFTPPTDYAQPSSCETQHVASFENSDALPSLACSPVDPSQRLGSPFQGVRSGPWAGGYLSEFNAGSPFASHVAGSSPMAVCTPSIEQRFEEMQSKEPGRNG